MGYVPTSLQPKPIGFFYPGTARRVWGSSGNGRPGVEFSKQLAKQGVCAFVVEYANWGIVDYPFTDFQLKAELAVSSSDSQSAVSVIDAANLACHSDHGMVVAGYSQGGHIASLSPKFNSHIKGIWSLASGIALQEAIFTTPNQERHSYENSCTFRSKNMMLSVLGATDKFFATFQPLEVSVHEQQRLYTGYNLDSCNSVWNCVQSDKSGYFIIRSIDNQWRFTLDDTDHQFFEEGDAFDDVLNPFFKEDDGLKRSWSIPFAVSFLMGRLNTSNPTPPTCD